MSETVVSSAETPRRPSLFAGVRHRVQLDRGEAAVVLRVVYAGVAAYAVLFVFAAVVHYAVFRTGRNDLGNMVQATWNTLHGHFLEGTTLSGQQRVRLGFHVDPFLLVFAPLYWIWSSPVLFPVVQALAVASGALPVFWLARKHLESPRAGAHFAFAYLLYPATQYAAFTTTSGFHPSAIAVPLVLYAIWFLDEDRLVAFSVVALLACTTKEEVPLAVGCLGIWYAVRRGHRLFGLSVFAIGLALTLFNFLWVIPHFAPTGTNPFSDRYAAVGGTPGGMVHKLFTDPAAFAHTAASGNKAVYVGLLLIPFLGLWLLEPLLLLGAVTDIAINLLSSASTSISAERTAPIIPFVVAASIFGAARFKSRALDLSLWVLAGAACVAVYSPLPLAVGDVLDLGSPVVSAEAHAVSLIPRGVPVSASDDVGGHISGRRYIYTFPTVGHARWIVVDKNDPAYANPAIVEAIGVRAANFRREIRTYESSTSWRTVYSQHGVIVLNKRQQ